MGGGGGGPFDCTTGFRQGAAGYTSSQDTYLRESIPDSVNGASSSWGWDNDDPNGGVIQRNLGLVRFGQIVGSQAGLIPIRADIVSATLTYSVFDEGGTGEAGGSSLG